MLGRKITRFRDPTFLTAINIKEMEVSEPHKNTYGPREFEHMLYDVIDTQR